MDGNAGKGDGFCQAVVANGLVGDYGVAGGVKARQVSSRQTLTSRNARRSSAPIDRSACAPPDDLQMTIPLHALIKVGISGARSSYSNAPRDISNLRYGSRMLWQRRAPPVSHAEIRCDHCSGATRAVCVHVRWSSSDPPRYQAS